MASNTGKRLNLNLVHNDEIWKDHVRHEFFSQRSKWPVRWGYLIDEYNTLTMDLLGPGVKSVPYYASKKSADLKLPPIVPEQKRRKPRVPDTTSKWIGWKSDTKLEIYGKYPKSRGQRGILNLLSWPEESHP